MTPEEATDIGLWQEEMSHVWVEGDMVWTEIELNAEPVLPLYQAAVEGLLSLRRTVSGAFICIGVIGLLWAVVLSPVWVLWLVLK